MQYHTVNVIIARRTGRKAGQTQFHPLHRKWFLISGILKKTGKDLQEKMLFYKSEF